MLFSSKKASSNTALSPLNRASSAERTSSATPSARSKSGTLAAGIVHVHSYSLTPNARSTPSPNTTVVVMVQAEINDADSERTWQWPDDVCASLTSSAHRRRWEAIARQGAKAGVGSQQRSSVHKGVAQAATGFEGCQSALGGGRQAPFFQEQRHTLRLLATQHSQEGMRQTG